jgi:uncharacterized protein (TIGR02118 family)
MIKLCCFVKRKPGMDRDAFHDHWLNAHGPLIRNTPELAKPVLRYEQNHRLDSDYERDPDGFDGVTVQWFDSFGDFAGFVQSDAYRDVLWHDEERFIDRAGLLMIFADPANRVIVDDSARAAAGVKLLCMLTRREGMEGTAFRQHWRTQHAGLFRDTPALARHIAAYEQHPRTVGDEARDTGGGPDGMAEQWYADLDAFHDFVREPAQADLIRPDEDRFIDRSKLQFVVTGPADVIIDDHDRDALESRAQEPESSA